MTFGVFKAVRRNHALEHGTVEILISRLPHLRLVGRAVTDGFYIYGRVPTEAIERSAHEALQRFKGGEAELAVTPHCGTNIAVAGLLLGTATLAARGSGLRMERWPSIVAAVMVSLLAAQPLGHLVQKYVTTSPDLGDAQIAGVRSGAGGLVHKVKTTGV